MQTFDLFGKLSVLLRLQWVRSVAMTKEGTGLKKFLVALVLLKQENSFKEIVAMSFVVNVA